MSNSPAPAGSSATSSRLQKIGSPSKRGKQHQTIRARRSTSAASVAHIRDTGTLAARVVFSAGERRLHLYGFSFVRPAIQVRRAAVENLAYDSRTQVFHFDLVAKPGTSPVVTLWAYPKRASFGDRAPLRR